MNQLLAQALQFALSAEQAFAAVRQVVDAVGRWRAVGQSAHVGMTTLELDAFKPAFEHCGLADAKKAGRSLGRARTKRGFWLGWRHACVGLASPSECPRLLK